MLRVPNFTFKTSISIFREINMIASDCDKYASHEITDNV